MADIQTNKQIKYYFKEDTNQILVSGSDTVAKTNAILELVKNPTTQANSFYNTKIVNFGVDTSYMVQNGAEFTTLIQGNVINSFSTVYVDNSITTSPIQITGNINGIGPASVILASTQVGNTYRILQITVVQIGSNWSIGETITIPQSTLISAGFVNPTADLIITLYNSNVNQYSTEIPLKTDQELWVYKGYNTVGGDGNQYRYNPHLHRAYKAYIVVETGSGIPSNPWSPVGNPINTDISDQSGGDIPGKYLEKQLAILGNSNSLTSDPVSGSFQIYNPSRGVRPFVFTKYQTLLTPPIVGSSFRVYLENTSSIYTNFSFSTSTTPPPSSGKISFNTTNENTTTEIYIDGDTTIDALLYPLSASYAYGKTGGKLRLASTVGTSNYVQYNINYIDNVANNYFKVNVSYDVESTPFTLFSNSGAGSSLTTTFSEFPQILSQIQQSQNTSPNILPFLPSTVYNRSGIYSYTSSAFPTQSGQAVGSTQFGLYTDYDFYYIYNARVDNLYPDTVRVYFTSSANTSSYVDIPRGYNANIPALLGTLSQVGYTPEPTDPTSFNLNSTYNGAYFDVTIGDPTQGTPPIPPDMFAKRWESVYISYSSSLSSSLDGLYVFNQLPQNDIQVTASMFITAWTGSAAGTTYGDPNSEYGTATYDVGEAGDGPTWPTASIRIYTGSYPNLIPQIGGSRIIDNFVTQSEFRNTNIHVSGLAITMSYLIPSQSISLKDCLSLSLAVSSGSANSSSVENSLVVREYYLEFNTPTSSLEGNGLIPTFLENAFEGTYGLSNTPGCQPMLNNASEGRSNPFIQEVDYSNGIYDPINFQAILLGNAQKSTVPESNYTQLASIFPRYLGSKTQANSVNSTAGLINGFGVLPVIDYKTAYFAYCDQVLDPYPVINNATQFNIKYLINEQGDALKPNTSPYTALDVEGSWTEGKSGIVAINQISGSSQFDQLNGLQPILKVAKEPIAVLWSQTGANTTASNIPLAGDANAISTYVTTFLSYNMGVQGRNTNNNNNNDKDIPVYNILDQIETPDLFTFTTSSKYGYVSLVNNTINQASSSIVSVLSPAPNPTINANTSPVNYAGAGEFYFNEDYLAISGSFAQPPGLSNISGTQLSDKYTISVKAEFPSTLPQRWFSWHSVDGVDHFGDENIGQIYMQLQVYSDGDWKPWPKIVMNSPPMLKVYFGNNQTLEINLAIILGDEFAGLRNQDTTCYIRISVTPIHDYIKQQGLDPENVIYTSFVFDLQNHPDQTFFANRRYRWIARQKYNDERPGVDPVNKWNPTITEQSQNGPYVTVRVQGLNSISSNVDGALNPPYWGFISGSTTNDNLLVSQSDSIILGTQNLNLIVGMVVSGGTSSGDAIITSISEDGLTLNLNIPQNIAANTTLTYTPPIIELLSGNGNAAYDGDYYQKYLPYTASLNPTFPGGLEPIDTTIPAYNIPWSLQTDDEIRFQNTETEAYTILQVIPPDQTGNGRLQLILDRPVNPITDKDFFLIRRYRYSPNTIVANSLFPYGSLKTEQRFIESNNIFTENSGAEGALYPASSTSTPTQSGSYVTLSPPLSKKDNTPSGLLLPEFPTETIEIEPDIIIQQLRNNKLIE